MHFTLIVMGNQKKIQFRMKLSIYISIIILILFCSCKTQYDKSNKYITDDLKIEQLTKNTFVHTSYLNTKSFGKVPCNGMIVIDNNEAIIYDTPVDNPTSLLLINWIRSTSAYCFVARSEKRLSEVRYWRSRARSRRTPRLRQRFTF